MKPNFHEFVDFCAGTPEGAQTASLAEEYRRVLEEAERARRKEKNRLNQAARRARLRGEPAVSMNPADTQKERSPQTPLKKKYIYIHAPAREDDDPAIIAELEKVLSPETARLFVHYLSEIGKPLKIGRISATISQIAAHAKPNDVVSRMIANGWRNLPTPETLDRHSRAPQNLERSRGREPARSSKPDKPESHEQRGKRKPRRPRNLPKGGKSATGKAKVGRRYWHDNRTANEKALRDWHREKTALPKEMVDSLPDRELTPRPSHEMHWVGPNFKVKP